MRPVRYTSDTAPVFHAHLLQPQMKLKPGLPSVFCGSIRGYKVPRAIAVRPSIIAPNRLQRKFTVERPDHAWVTDIPCIRTLLGWLYHVVVVGWSMIPTLAHELVVDALMTAISTIPTLPW